MTLIVTATHRRRKNCPACTFPRHRDIRSYEFTSVSDVCNFTPHLVHLTDSWTGDSEINILLGRTYVLPKGSLTPILSPAPPAERSNECRKQYPPSPCIRGYHVTLQAGSYNATASEE